MDGIFKGFNTYQAGMFFGGKEIEWGTEQFRKNL